MRLLLRSDREAEGQEATAMPGARVAQLRQKQATGRAAALTSVPKRTALTIAGNGCDRVLIFRESNARAYFLLPRPPSS